MTYLVFKALHIIFMVTWFAGLFYLPRIFVYHASTNEAKLQATFKIMERKLLIMTHIGGGLTFIFGLLLLAQGQWIFFKQGWFHAKLLLLFVLVVFHIACWYFVKQFANDVVTKNHVYFRWFNEIPVIPLIGIVLLAVLKPF